MTEPKILGGFDHTLNKRSYSPQELMSVMKRELFIINNGILFNSERLRWRRWIDVIFKTNTGFSEELLQVFESYQSAINKFKKTYYERIKLSDDVSVEYLKAIRNDSLVQFMFIPNFHDYMNENYDLSTDALRNLMYHLIVQSDNDIEKLKQYITLVVSEKLSPDDCLTISKRVDKS